MGVPFIEDLLEVLTSGLVAASCDSEGHAWANLLKGSVASARMASCPDDDCCHLVP